MDKRDARKLSTKAQQELRTLAVQLKESGKKYSEIAEIIKVHPTTICTWYKAYQKGGIEALKVTTHTKKNKKRLTGFFGGNFKKCKAVGKSSVLPPKIAQI